MNNLMNSQDPAHRAVLTRLRGVLDRWIIKSDDQGRFPEPPEVVAALGATKPAAAKNEKPQ